jgi:uncharacterized protein YebE (UPF0316 family)
MTWAFHFVEQNITVSRPPGVKHLHSPPMAFLAHQPISTSAHQHISTSAHQPISTSAHQHISTSTMNLDFFARFFDSTTFMYVILPLLIFLFRIIDQSIGTLRLIFAAKGLKRLAPFFAFFESFIWLVAIGQIMKHLDNIYCYIAFAGGYAAGNFFGILLEEKLSIGTVVIRVIPKKDTTELIAHLRRDNYGVTVVPVDGMMGPTKMLFTTVRRKEAAHVIEIIKMYNPTAFYTIDEVKTVSGGYFERRNRSIFSVLNPFQKTVKS